MTWGLVQGKVYPVECRLVEGVANVTWSLVRGEVHSVVRSLAQGVAYTVARSVAPDEMLEVDHDHEDWVQTEIDVKGVLELNAVLHLVVHSMVNLSRQLNAADL